MVPNILTVVLSTVLACGPALAAAPQTPAKEAKPAQDAKPAAKDDKSVQPAARPVAKEGFSLRVTGLTKDNAAAAKTALAGLKLTTYSCAECGSEMAMPGNCGACAVPLTKHEQAVFESATPAADAGTVAFRLDKGSKVRLSQIESALRASSVQVDRKMLELTGPFVAVFQGGASREDAGMLQKALRDGGLKDATATFDPESKEVQVRVTEGAGSWTMLADLGAKLSKPERLTDIQWMAGPRG